tara:strand:+ start:292 stop:510 length:219 start_codon:yes stop_codon:yes gene_type:complete
MTSKRVILEVGDLVRIKQSIYAPFYTRPDLGLIGMILEIDYHDLLGTLYYVQTIDGVWKFSDYELELLDESR